MFSWNLFIAIPLFHLSRSCRKERNCTNILLLNKLYEKPATQMYRVSIESTDLKPITLDRLLICVTLGFYNLPFTTWKVIRTFVVAKDSTVQHSLIFAYIRRKIYHEPHYNVNRHNLERKSACDLFEKFNYALQWLSDYLDYLESHASSLIKKMKIKATTYNISLGLLY